MVAPDSLETRKGMSQMKKGITMKSKNAFTNPESNEFST